MSALRASRACRASTTGRPLGACSTSRPLRSSKALGARTTGRPGRSSSPGGPSRAAE
ncbi:MULTISPECIES: hypothetical protein [unclassified Cyanobium]|uniref:hypothetical protein n=1 Tax=unclassified Cyanobium TaxID=2627006 RepID=UPI0020CDB290|nr:MULTISPECIES: hypothetical protein [unclassified Cyanobium]MCP9860980.1 hypothetical protein [Cyanobium sp. Cruz-8H5]MCP9868192.1 hypothetical protein [Cyanobium sp. Cruz-8D1]